ncbi:MAG: cupin domain-containing protein [Geminicoccaceae bacterium]|nr:cupin domain-containing protein [Geminicoccaceae bacterium]MCS7268686.1 cupin domain-containing protein [Geminicoccaceae bacterium]MDW8125830.1 cupin domain-containing protein [Geminicoccaceae bacterium]MDW8341493.1 cupin domain-containing protein [Geminicoccaceae bacterium]
MTFDEIMAPLGAARFLEEYLGKAPLHLEGPPDKWAAVMNWDVLNRLLGASTIWSHASLPLVLDKEPVPPSAYCAPAPGRDGGTVLRPDPTKVKAYLRRGATLVANDIDQLTPELRAFCRAMEEALGGKVQANLYLSSKRRQGFAVHFDTHDVFAVHCMGEKTWMVFEGRAEDPIAHPMFKTLPPEHHEKAKGKLWKEVRLKPGDLLYLPRGQYHYALAEDGACCHIAFGVTYPIGLDVVTYLFERMVAEPLARANLPREPAALARRLAALGDRLAALCSDARTLSDIRGFVAGYRYPREDYDLPDLIERAPNRFRRCFDDFKLVEQGGKTLLVRTSTREGVEVPAAIKELVGWVVAREGFERAELERAFPSGSGGWLDTVLAQLEKMRVIAPS